MIGVAPAARGGLADNAHDGGVAHTQNGQRQQILHAGIMTGGVIAVGVFEMKWL